MSSKGLIRFPGATAVYSATRGATADEDRAGNALKGVLEAQFGIRSGSALHNLHDLANKSNMRQVNMPRGVPKREQVKYFLKKAFSRRALGLMGLVSGWAATYKLLDPYGKSSADEIFK